jgi:hypothetical protein
MDRCVTHHTTVPRPSGGPADLTGPAGSAHSGGSDVVLSPAAERARRLLRGYGPTRLMAEVSVARVAGMVADSVREPARWLRPVLAGLDAFRQVLPDGDLDAALAAAWAEPWRADHWLAAFAAHLGAGPPELARLGLGPKLWFTVNGVPVAWRSLPSGGSAPATGTQLRLTDTDRLSAAARVLLRAGVTPPELSRLRLGDLGRLVPGEVFVPDLMASPLAVRLRPGARGAGRAAPWLVLLGHEARITVIAAVLARYGPDAACRHGADLLLPAEGPRSAGIAGREGYTDLTTEAAAGPG